MHLWIDGRKTEAKAGQTILDLADQLGLCVGSFCDRPIAANIAGDVFTLNYVPVRSQEEEAPMVRRAMEASGGHVRLLSYRDPAGKDVYDRTAQFLIFCALDRLYPGKVAKMGCTVGAGL